jgi:3-oxoacyl-[acyl-carrier protein] reductase
MELGIRGRVALVTGASAGLGEAVALQLAQEGAALALAARRTDKLEDVAARAKALGAPDARAFAVDQNEPGAMRRLVDEARGALGEIDIVIANGGGPRPGRYLDLTPPDWDAAYHGLLRSMLELTYATVPRMRERRWGRVVALTSTSVKEPMPRLVLSSAFRTALVSALKALSNDVAADGVTLNAIATGRIKTDRLRTLYDDEAALDAAAAADIPMARAGTPEEFAPLVVFLCSEAARYVTGQTIAIDGGLIKSLL